MIWVPKISRFTYASDYGMFSSNIETNSYIQLAMNNKNVTATTENKIVHIQNWRRIGCYCVKYVTFTEFWHVIVAWIECVTNSVDTKWKTKRAK